MKVYRERWSRLWHRLGTTGDSAESALHGILKAHALLDELVAAYTQPHRTYHDMRHIDDCLDCFDEHRDLAERPDEVELALWFHDAIYDTHRRDNEEKSAEWCARALGDTRVNEEIVTRVSDLILATDHGRGQPQSNDAKLVVDIDLHVLAAPEHSFDVYDNQVRHEYAWVPEEDYRRERARILRRFLERGPVYQLEPLRALWEARARGNLERAIARLE